MKDVTTCAVKRCRRWATHTLTFERGDVLLDVTVCERHASKPIPFPNGDLDRPIASVRLDR